jgi:hypothetical protein
MAWLQSSLVSIENEAGNRVIAHFTADFVVNVVGPAFLGT